MPLGPGPCWLRGRLEDGTARQEIGYRTRSSRGSLSQGAGLAWRPEGSSQAPRRSSSRKRVWAPAFVALLWLTVRNAEQTTQGSLDEQSDSLVQNHSICNRILRVL